MWMSRRQRRSMSARPPSSARRGPEPSRGFARPRPGRGLARVAMAFCLFAAANGQNVAGESGTFVDVTPNVQTQLDGRFGTAPSHRSGHTMVRPPARPTARASRRPARRESWCSFRTGRRDVVRFGTRRFSFSSRVSRRVARARRGKNEKDTLQAGERSNEASASRASRGDAPSFTLKILSRRGALASFGPSASSAAASAYVTTETRGRRAGLARPAPAGTRGPRRAPARDPLASPTRRPNDPARAVDELAVDDIAARVVAVDMACVLVPARAPLTRTTARHRVYSKHHRYFLSAQADRSRTLESTHGSRASRDPRPRADKVPQSSKN